MSLARRGALLVAARHYGRSRPTLGLGDSAKKVGEKVKDYFTKVTAWLAWCWWFPHSCSQGNLVNPRASDPMQPDDYRKHSPASTEPVNLPHSDNPETIYYYPRSARQFVEDQVVILKVRADSFVWY
jgi:hypothetical protein